MSDQNTNAEGQENETSQPSHEETMIRKAVETGSAKVPDQFANANDPVAAWIDSYKNTKASLTQAQQKLAAQKQNDPAPNAESNTEGVEDFDPAAALEEAANEPVDEKAQVDWDAVKKEMASTGGLTEETRKSLTALNVPDHMIDAAVAGFKAQQRELATQAAQVMGGADRMKKVIDWAKQTLPKEEQAALAQQLRQPGWQMTLRGLSVQYDEANKNHEPKQDIQNETASSDDGARPWGSTQEMTAAMADPRYRYRTDADFVKMVEDRCRASYGKGSILRTR